MTLSFKPLVGRVALPFVAILTAAVTASPVQAGWDNVFQVACWRCKDRVSRRAPVSYYTPAPTSTSRYETRYEDVEKTETVTVMKPTTVQEPVEVKVRSSYWDPVTTYTTRRYRNANGCIEEVSVPCTSFVKKETCNTVTKYVERMKMVPVQETRRYIERTPVTTIVGPTTRQYVNDCDNCGLPATPRTPEIQVEPGTGSDTRLPAQSLPMNRSLKAPLAPAKPFTGTVNARTTSYSSAVRGEVLAADRVSPKAGVPLVFLNDADYTDTVRATADDYGNFVVALPAGKWHVYVGNDNGRADRTTAITVTPYDSRPVTVVSR